MCLLLYYIACYCTKLLLLQATMYYYAILLGLLQAASYIAMALLLLCACPTTHIWHLLHTLLNPKLVEISPSSSYFYLVRMFSLTLYWALCFSFEQSTYMTVFFPFSRYSLHALMMASHCSFGLIHFFWLVWIFRKQSKGLPDRCLTTARCLPDSCLTAA